MFRLGGNDEGGISPPIAGDGDVESEEVVFGGGIADEYDFRGQDREMLLLDNEYDIDGVASEIEERRESNDSAGGIHLVIASALMRRLGHIYAVASALVLVIAVPILIITAYRDYHDRPDFAAFNSAGTFVLVTVVMSNFQIYRRVKLCSFAQKLSLCHFLTLSPLAFQPNRALGNSLAGTCQTCRSSLSVFFGWSHYMLSRVGLACDFATLEYILIL
mmetsp:Transcript_16214/g.46719  ORF Transcript_16214/g.46719 Transcript_16214/m.46719 type:complete len:218 (+) Transcript_16214:125-778(+)